MPFTIDQEALKTQTMLDTSRPQGTQGGLPVKAIPFLTYPRCVYRHPKEPFRTIIHRNAMREIVDREVVLTEAEVHVCQNEHEFKAKLKQGWVPEPYLPPVETDGAERATTAAAGE